VGTPSNDTGCLMDFCRNIKRDSLSSLSDEREILTRRPLGIFVKI
jgi:hypothetical protein